MTLETRRSQWWVVCVRHEVTSCAVNSAVTYKVFYPSILKVKPGEGLLPSISVL